ncbi:polyprenol monophosphomannose synthase [Haloechinothrix sp. YIM 98757]|uniref:Polyprenol monophosphomannose synthase n=1 Tax=Haloechinothrix aidingensis TaxID=2752311 RepID=A0A838A9M3_9PSEU|nr:polyprenol monophosphomannose synthase [Haloechinothrix aidingensis]MBA0125837.1 polyprenol monophosphomannose synthase [Haloechinothrix aidingensis]
MDNNAVLVIVPTYNERDNIGSLVTRLHRVRPDSHVLVVDDGSPDGTGALAEELASRDERVHVLHRKGKAGLGAAYIAGFRWGLDREFGTLVEMDADGSHAPEDLPRILAAVTEHDLVIGSRYVPGGSVVNWPRRRKMLSKGGNLYSRLALGVRVKDITAGYRAYRRAVLDVLPLEDADSQGYCFQIDLAWRAIRAGFSVAEVPITFTEREVGHSKMTGSIVREAVLNVGAWGLRHRGRQLRAALARRNGPRD